jgi:hypothetical protein
VSWGSLPLLAFLGALAVVGVRCAGRPKVDPKTLEQAFIDSTAQECRNRGGYIYREEGTDKRWCEYQSRP